MPRFSCLAHLLSLGTNPARSKRFRFRRQATVGETFARSMRVFRGGKMKHLLLIIINDMGPILPAFVLSRYFPVACAKHAMAGKALAPRMH